MRILGLALRRADVADTTLRRTRVTGITLRRTHIPVIASRRARIEHCTETEGCHDRSRESDDAP